MIRILIIIDAAVDQRRRNLYNGNVDDNEKNIFKARRNLLVNIMKADNIFIFILEMKL